MTYFSIKTAFHPLPATRTACVVAAHINGNRITMPTISSNKYCSCLECLCVNVCVLRQDSNAVEIGGIRAQVNVCVCVLPSREIISFFIFCLATVEPTCTPSLHETALNLIFKFCSIFRLPLSLATWFHGVATGIGESANRIQTIFCFHFGYKFYRRIFGSHERVRTTIVIAGCSWIRFRNARRPVFDLSLSQ